MQKKLMANDDEIEVSYEDTPEIRDAVFEKVMDFFKKYEAYSGEDIGQRDETIIEAYTVFSDIADNVMKFKLRYVEEG